MFCFCYKKGKKDIEFYKKEQTEICIGNQSVVFVFYVLADVSVYLLKGFFLKHSATVTANETAKPKIQAGISDFWNIGNVLAKRLSPIIYTPANMKNRCRK